MPRKPIDYSKIIIYKIVCKDINKKEIEISYTNNLTVRRNLHKKHSKDLNYTKNSYYNYIRENGGWNNFDTVVLEKFNAIDADDVKRRIYEWKNNNVS